MDFFSSARVLQVTLMLVTLPNLARAAENFSWSTCYAGAQLAAVRSQSDDWTPQTSGGAYTGQTLGSHVARGGAAGLQVGCNRQMPQNFVFGIQADYAQVNATGQHDSTRETGVTYGNKVKSLASVTLLAGYLIQPDLLGYFRAGPIWEHGEYWATTTSLGTAYLASATRAGWMFGLGAEYGFARHWSGFVEVNYRHFGERKIAVAPQIFGLPPAVVGISQKGTLLRAGLNYRF